MCRAWVNGGKILLLRDSKQGKLIQCSQDTLYRTRTRPVNGNPASDKLTSGKLGSYRSSDFSAKLYKDNCCNRTAVNTSNDYAHYSPKKGVSTELLIIEQHTPNTSPISYNVSSQSQ